MTVNLWGWWGKLSNSQYAKTAVFLAVIYLPLVFIGRGLLPGAIMGGVLACCAHLILRQHLRGLAARAAVADSVSWDVEIGGAKVGTLADAAYAQTRHDVLSETQHHIAQALNVVQGMKNIVVFALKWLPSAAFWSTFAVAIGWPELLVNVAVWARDSATQPADVIRAAAIVLQVLGVLLILAAVFAATHVPRAFGFPNRFDEEIGDALCRRFGVAEGQRVVLSRPVDTPSRPWDVLRAGRASHVAFQAIRAAREKR